MDIFSVPDKRWVSGSCLGSMTRQRRLPDPTDDIQVLVKCNKKNWCMIVQLVTPQMVYMIPRLKELTGTLILWCFSSLPLSA